MQPARQRIAVGQRYADRKRIPFRIDKHPGRQLHADHVALLEYLVRYKTGHSRRIIDLGNRHHKCIGSNSATAIGCRHRNRQTAGRFRRRCSGKTPVCRIKFQPRRQRLPIGHPGRQCQHIAGIRIEEHILRQRKIQRLMLDNGKVCCRIKNNRGGIVRMPDIQRKNV